MKFEIDMLSVGNADAILIRYFGNNQDEIVILIDAGRTEHGQQVANHILKYTDHGKINLAICTHSDEDHIGGFAYILNNGIEIDEFWMHDPINYRDKIAILQNESWLNDIGVLKESLNNAVNLMNKIRGNILHQVPFAGLEYTKAPLRILAPTEDYYINRLKGFRDIKNLIEAYQYVNGESVLNLLLENQMGIDPSKSNNSSAITFFYPGNFKYLFTADADVSGLKAACAVQDLSNLDWLQVPHHGSINNINLKVAQYLNPKTAFISASGKESKPHPDVIAILKQTRAKIFITEGISLLRRYNTASRPNYNPAVPIN